MSWLLACKSSALCSGLVGARAVVICQHRGLLYSPKKGVGREWIAFLQQPIDLSPSSILRWLRRKKYEIIVDEHKFIPEKVHIFGPDIAAAHFVVARDGAVKFENIDRWIYKNKDGSYSLPAANLPHLKVEAIDMSKTNVMYNSFDHFGSLERLKYLNISESRYIDDWCLDRMSQLRDNLLVLDISRCPQVTERGIQCLHRLRSLRRLIMSEMPNVKDFELLKVMLEEAIPGCLVEGNPPPISQSSEEKRSIPTFIKQYELAARQKDISRQLNDPRNINNKLTMDDILQSETEKAQLK